MMFPNIRKEVYSALAELYGSAAAEFDATADQVLAESGTAASEFKRLACEYAILAAAAERLADEQ